MNYSPLYLVALLALFFSFFPDHSVAAEPPVEFREGMAISRVAQSGRRPFSPDAVAALIARGEFSVPGEGDTVTTADGTKQTWRRVMADKDGTFDEKAVTGGYLCITLDAPEARVALLDASGQGMVYVNGEPRVGDPYGFGRLKLPVALKAGRNVFLFAGSRGTIRAKLSAPSAPAFFEADENTLPDVRVGETGPLWASVVVANATVREATGLTIEATVEAAGKRQVTRTSIPALPPLSIRKVAFRFNAPSGAAAGEAKLLLSLQTAGKAQDAATLPIRIRGLQETYKRTFISQIDGSVQYYAVRPALKPGPTNALIISLHGASVEALGQADAYGPKEDATLVAPTNRRPYGFDWEDTGRLDALEVMAIAERTIPHDPARVSLTGHSMGGHGTWAIGSLFPDRFAAIAPSAGWISFTSYAGGAKGAANATPAEDILSRGQSIHDTLLRAGNLLTLPIFVLHGDADDNVPVTEARQMRDHLTGLGHKRLAYYEEPGANHWWDKSPAPGADAVDYAPMISLLTQSRIVPPQERSEIAFVTANPAVSAKNGWLTIEQQEQSLSPSSATFSFDAKNGTLRGTTKNVRRFTIDVDSLPEAATSPLRQAEIDGQTLPLRTSGDATHFLKSGDRWQFSDPTPAAEKNPKRGGPFKEAFQNRFVLIYGTLGTPEENAWMFAQARYDAEVFLYRGNGSPDVLSDREYLERERRSGRNAIVYGNETINAAWRLLLKDSPIRAERGKLSTVKLALAGETTACAFVRPLPNSETGLVAAIGGTGLIGMRSTTRLPYFVSGAAFPDWVIFDPTAIERGAASVLEAGYFGNDWH